MYCYVSSIVESVGAGHIPVTRSTTHQPIRKYIQLHQKIALLYPGKIRLKVDLEQLKSVYSL